MGSLRAVEAACRTCELVARRDAGEAPAWDSILRTEAWDVAHAYGTSVPGWLVLVLRRHVTALADMTEDEASELGPLLQSVSRALHEVTGCAKTYVVQFAEAADHPHVHVHVIPRSPNLPNEYRGPSIFKLLGVPSDQWVHEDRMNDVAGKLKAELRGPAG